MSTTYRRQSLVHATTWRSDLCASYRALWRGCDVTERWTVGAEHPPNPHQFSLHIICSDCRKDGTAEKGGPKEMQISTDHPMDYKKLHFQRLVCMTRPDGTVWKEVIWTSHSAISRTMVYHIFFTVWIYKNLKMFFVAYKRCTERLGVTSVNAILSVVVFIIYTCTCTVYIKCNRNATVLQRTVSASCHSFR